MEDGNSSSKCVVLEKFKSVTPIFHALGDENRQIIVMLLMDHGCLNVNQLTDNMVISRPAVSHHLKILRDAGLVIFKKSNTEKIYSLSPEAFLASFKDLIHTIETTLG
ncbi:MAG: metalloregulator ArsR/SmtB family transcription factor [Sporolactobacillus sp.]